MSGAADLGAAGRERPQAPGRRAFGGEDEGRLGLVELAGDVREDVVAESVAAVDDGQRVAGSGVSAKTSTRAKRSVGIAVIVLDTGPPSDRDSLR